MKFIGKICRNLPFPLAGGHMAASAATHWLNPIPNLI